MAIGERIGQAYVKVILQGEDDTRFEKTMEGVGAKAGKKAGASMADETEKEFVERIRKGRRFNTISKDLSNVFKKMRLIDDATADQWWKRVETQISKRVKDSDVAETIMRDLRQKFTDSGGDFELLSGIVTDPGKLRQQLDKASAEVEKFRQREAAAQEKADADALKKLRKQREDGLRAIEKFQKELGRGLIRDFKNLDEIVQNLAKGGDGFGVSINEARRDVDRLFTSLNNQDKEVFERLFGANSFDRFHNNLIRLKKDVDTAHPAITRFNNRLDEFAAGMGRAFGRGSRSELLNFFGRLVENTARAGFGLLRLGQNAFKFGQLFGAGFGGADGNFFAKLAAGASNAGLTLNRLGTAMLSIGTAGAVVSGIVGVVVAALSLLTGTIVALAGSITFAIGAAIAPLVGILTPLGVGIGFLALTFGTMTKKAHDAFIEGIQPLHEALIGFAKVAQKPILENFGKQMKDLSKGLKDANFKELFETSGKAFSAFISQIVSASQRGVFKQFIKDLTDFIPVLSRQMGEITIALGAGLAGVFRASIPATTAFLKGLNEVLVRFATFANSTRGQNAMKKFFDDAIVSAKAVGGFLKELGGLFKDLFVAGKDTGDDLFRSMRDAIADFREFLKEDPERLSKWFEDAKSFAKALGDVFVAFGKVADALDNVITRKAAVAILEGVAKALEAIAKISSGDFSGLVAVGAFMLTLSKLKSGGGKGGLAATATDVGKLGAATEGLAASANKLPKLGIGAKILGPLTIIGAIGAMGDALKNLKNSFLAIFGNDEAEAALKTKAAKDRKAVEDAWNGFDKWFSENLSQPFRDFLGLPPLKPKVDTTEVKNAKTDVDTLASAYGLTKSELTTAQAKVETQQLKDAKVLLDTLATTLGLGFPTGTVTVDAPTVPPVAEDVRDIYTLLTGSPPPAVVDVSAGPNLQPTKNQVEELNGLLGSVPPEVDTNITDNGTGKETSATAKDTTRSLIGVIGKYLGVITDGGTGATTSDQATSTKSILDTIKGVYTARITATDGVSSVLNGIISKATAAAKAISKIFGAEGGIALPGGGLARAASGKVARFQQQLIVGEAGPEAVVPLNRPLGRVDPSVRALSAIAQGKLGDSSLAGANKADGTTNIFNIVSNAENPVTVAREVLAHATAGGY